MTEVISESSEAKLPAFKAGEILAETEHFKLFAHFKDPSRPQPGDERLFVTAKDSVGDRLISRVNSEFLDGRPMTPFEGNSASLRLMYTQVAYGDLLKSYHPSVRAHSGVAIEEYRKKEAEATGQSMDDIVDKLRLNGFLTGGMPDHLPSLDELEVLYLTLQSEGAVGGGLANPHPFTISKHLDRYRESLHSASEAD